MKNLGEMLQQQGPFSEIVLGNTALARAMIESGTEVITSYPGSPTPEIASALLSIPAGKRPFYFEFSTNEKVATEVACGASLNGHPSCVFFKSVGLNVAADSFVQLSLMELTGGLVAVLGDDPGANSSQNEQDNRHVARMAYIPVLEPSSPSEAYRYYLEAMALSRRMKMPVILRMTTHVCHGKEKVAFGAWEKKAPGTEPRFDSSAGPSVPLTSAALEMKRRALARLSLAGCEMDSPAFCEVRKGSDSFRGVITAGLPFRSLLDVLEDSEQSPDILKLGVVYPLPEKTIEEFLRSHKQVKILEELDDVMEKEIKALAFDRGMSVSIIGKSDEDDWIGEYTPDKVSEVMAKTWPDMIPLRGAKRQPSLAPRPPQMCPGCGHRSAFYAVRKALAKEDITVADIGCHTLGFLPPYKVGEVLLSMGHSTGTGAGLSLFNKTRKVVSFIGDSTLFHAGLPGIVNAVFNNHNLTLIVMENGTTAMTGHQDHPGAGRNANGPSEAIPIRGVLEGLGVKSIREVDAYSQAKLIELVKEANAEEGFSVVIARHPCMLKYTREQQRSPDYVRKSVEVDQEKCDRLHVCVESFGCPSFQRDEDGTVTVSPELCIGDGSCIQTCPVKAIGLRKESRGGEQA
ncbi:thiamine pyrophosphate-dependent enzyme [Aminivibrio sp.]|uniref:thiamine pyrophosphate-dependent enzyme n=1 Tax=Aminivibrio sp. TaxID=1872489 RepID=UPI00345F0696